MASILSQPQCVKPAHVVANVVRCTSSHHLEGIHRMGHISDLETSEDVNSLSPGRCGCADFKCVNFKHNLEICVLSIQVSITLE